MSGEYIGKIVECGDRKYMVVEEVLTRGVAARPG